MLSCKKRILQSYPVLQARTCVRFREHSITRPVWAGDGSLETTQISQMHWGYAVRQLYSPSR